jgi:tRNA pseudouridine32 synthase/23S rRNA pseudouridine746 synthase
MEHLASCETLQPYLNEGKMFGVLVVRCSDGSLGFLAAFSGQLGGRQTHGYFVPPIFDYLAPDGYFKQEETAISKLNNRIDELLCSQELVCAKSALLQAQTDAHDVISTAKKNLQAAKKARALRRQSGLSADEESVLIRESQFEKAEFKRLERRLNSVIAERQAAVNVILADVEKVKSERKRRSADLQFWLFEQFRVLNARGESMTLNEIFRLRHDKIPPAGAGECAAPKLLQYAYLNGLTPVSMCEFWWGPSPENEVRHQGFFYPSCRSKCEPILNFMLQGVDVEPNPLTADKQLSLNILYEDDYIIVVNKSIGMLSVPGKESYDSVQSILQSLSDSDGFPVAAHRLDMSTSGLLVMAKDKRSLANLHRQFESKSVKKRYVAILDGVPTQSEGIVSLPLCLNVDNPPEQIVSQNYGKEAITHYKVVSSSADSARVEFYPITGRTHQLRVHAAHRDGLNCPIKGDSLYGKSGSRLFLHSEMIEFSHPATGEIVRFECKAEF